jgi:TPR repeat protein
MTTPNRVETPSMSARTQTAAAWIALYLKCKKRLEPWAEFWAKFCAAYWLLIIGSFIMISLGIMYENGQGVPRDYAKARDWYLKAGSTGLINIAKRYRNGDGVPQDYTKARELLEVAVELDDDDAMAAIGSLYLNGLGVPQNTSKALEWFDRATRVSDYDGRLAKRIATDAYMDVILRGAPTDSLESVLPRGMIGPVTRFGSFGSGSSCATSIEGVGAR